jgi:opacity protein-like surface antigen
MLIFSSQFASGRQGGFVSQSNPIKPGQMVYPVEIGLYSGINNPLSPSEIVNKPTTAAKDIQQSLLNGFDGLGFGPTVNLGVVVKYPLSETFYLGANVEYSGWKSNNSCNCSDNIDKSLNSLNLIHFGLMTQYYLYDLLYASGELGLNLLDAKATENSNRGNLDFTKSYTRIGAGFGLGYEIPLTNKYSIDLSAKGQFPNLFLGEDNLGNSESLINSTGNSNEATIFILSLNIGFLFSL